MNFNQYLDKVIKSKSITKLELSRRLGMKSPIHIQKIAGPSASSIPRFATFYRIVQALDCTEKAREKLVDLAKKAHPKEPYELILRKQDNIHTDRLRPKYQRYYDRITKILESQPFFTTLVNGFLDYLEYMCEQFRKSRKQQILTDLPGGEKFLKRAKRKLEAILEDYPEDVAAKHDLGIVESMLAGKEAEKNIKKGA